MSLIDPPHVITFPPEMLPRADVDEDAEVIVCCGGLATIACCVAFAGGAAGLVTAGEPAGVFVELAIAVVAVGCAAWPGS